LVQGRGKLTTNSGGKKVSYRPKVEVFCKESQVAETLFEHFGGRIREDALRYPPYSALWVWEVKGGRAIEVLKRITPYLSGTTGSHAEYILKRQQERAA
jgi:hypothetical protein